MTTVTLHGRVREMRSRAAIRAWELRQLTHARGAWFRLARLLASSRRAWTITESDLRTLEEQGFQPHPVGLEFQPPRKFFVISEHHLSRLGTARELPLVAGPELLVATSVALIPFDE